MHMPISAYITVSTIKCVVGNNMDRMQDATKCSVIWFRDWYNHLAPRKWLILKGHI